MSYTLVHPPGSSLVDAALESGNIHLSGERKTSRPLSDWARYIKANSGAIRAEYGSQIKAAQNAGDRGAFFKFAKKYAVEHGFQFQSVEHKKAKKLAGLARLKAHKAKGGYKRAPRGSRKIPTEHKSLLKGIRGKKRELLLVALDNGSSTVKARVAAPASSRSKSAKKAARTRAINKLLVGRVANRPRAQKKSELPRQQPS